MRDGLSEKKTKKPCNIVAVGPLDASLIQKNTTLSWLCEQLRERSLLLSLSQMLGVGGIPVFLSMMLNFTASLLSSSTSRRWACEWQAVFPKNSLRSGGKDSNSETVWHRKLSKPDTHEILLGRVSYSEKKIGSKHWLSVAGYSEPCRHK